MKHTKFFIFALVAAMTFSACGTDDTLQFYYPESNFSIVKNQPVQYMNWDLEKCLARKEKETQKILDYIFN
jgi:hypothetical protein